MTDYKHPNMYSGHATLQEIARWGEDHTDEWVRKMAYLAHLVDVSLPKNANVEEWFDEYADTLHSASSDAEWAEERAVSAENEIVDLKAKCDALLLDLDVNEQQRTINHLKQRLGEANHELMRLNGELEVTRSNFDALQKNYKYLEEKHNTFTILAT